MTYFFNKKLVFRHVCTKEYFLKKENIIILVQ